MGRLRGMRVKHWRWLSFNRSDDREESDGNGRWPRQERNQRSSNGIQRHYTGDLPDRLSISPKLGHRLATTLPGIDGPMAITLQVHRHQQGISHPIFDPAASRSCTYGVMTGQEFDPVKSVPAGLSFVNLVLDQSESSLLYVLSNFPSFCSNAAILEAYK
jgi:hypothetical protein